MSNHIMSNNLFEYWTHFVSEISNTFMFVNYTTMKKNYKQEPTPPRVKLSYIVR